jgi:hypothetical protein
MYRSRSRRRWLPGLVVKQGRLVRQGKERLCRPQGIRELGERFDIPV